MITTLYDGDGRTEVYRDCLFIGYAWLGAIGLWLYSRSGSSEYSSVQGGKQEAINTLAGVEA